jgi:hypothetical protein
MNFFRQSHEFGWYGLSLIQIQQDTEIHRKWPTNTVHKKVMEIIWRVTNETADLKSCSKWLSEETPARNQISSLINLVGYGQQHFSGTEDGKGVGWLCSVCNNFESYKCWMNPSNHCWRYRCTNKRDWEMEFRIGRDETDLFTHTILERNKIQHSYCKHFNWQMKIIWYNYKNLQASAT